MKNNNSEKITEALLQMSEKKPKMRESTTKIIQQNKKTIEQLKKMNYSYVDIANFLNDQDIKISSNQIGKAIRDLQTKKIKPIDKETEKKESKKTFKEEKQTPRHVTTDQDDDIFKKASIKPS